MHIIHWSSVIGTATIGATLTAMPSNPALGDRLSANTIHSVNKTSSSPAKQREIAPTEGGEIIHGVIFLALVMVVVATSRIIRNKT